MNDLLAYERLDENKILDAIRLLPGEFIMMRRPFRWMKDGEVVPNAYESFRLEGICEDNGWKIVERYGEHIAICKED